MPIRIKNVRMRDGKIMVNIPESRQDELEIDGADLTNVEQLLYIRTPDFSIPEADFRKLVELATSSDRPVEETVSEYVHEGSVARHLKDNGYNIAQVVLSLTAVITDLLAKA
jgi:hypothetical protein